MASRPSRSPRGKSRKSSSTPTRRRRRAARPVRESELRWTCPASWIPAAPKRKAGREVSPSERLFGQERALEAIELGLGVRAPGYNVFISGIGGTDRTEVVRELLARLQLSCAIPRDHVVLFNFDDPMQPRHLALPPGGGPALREGMERWVGALRTELPKLLRSEEHLARRQALFDRYRKAETQLIQRLDRRLRAVRLGLATVEDDAGRRHDIFFRVDGKLLPAEEVEKLPGKVRPKGAAWKKMREARANRLPWVDEAMRKSRALGLRLLREARSLDEGVIQGAVQDLTLALADELEADLPLGAWLGGCANFALNHSGLFLSSDGDDDEDSGRLGLEVYEVNIVRSVKGDACPVVHEPHPNYSNLFGTVERTRMQNGPGHVHLAVRPGSILGADGGFLVLDARDILRESQVWRALKRTLQTGQLAVHALENLSPLGVTGARPEPIDLDIKVVLVGDNGLYEGLHDEDFDFLHIFKVKAEFDDSLPLERGHVRELVRCLRGLEAQEQLLPIARSGMQALVERAVRDAGGRGRLSSRLPQVADYAREASWHAARSGSRSIDREAVETARRAFRAQHALDAEWYQRQMEEGIYRIATEGAIVGMVNGLTVVSLGPLGFGRPARVAASVTGGDDSLTSLDREVDLAGGIHNKGLLTVEQYLRARYGETRSLPTRTSLVFEQNYGPIDGDSASSTELYAVLSALAGLPVRQDVAVTGAIDLRGELTAVGGINEKIEGFYDLCRSRGLTGTQGALIPEVNVRDLMLPLHLVEDIKAGNFHLWAADDIDQALTLLTGTPAAEIHAKVEARLDELEKAAKAPHDKDAAESKEGGDAKAKAD